MRHTALLRRHREHDRLDSGELALVHVEALELLAEPRHELHDALERAHPPQHPVAREEVVERELARPEPPLHLGLVVLGRRGLGLLDQRQDVPHAEDPGRHAVGVEVLELVELLADRGELDRPARDLLDGERGSPASVAVELRHDDAVEGDALLERARDVDGFLARHGVEHEQDVQRLRRLRDPLELGHELLVDVQAAGGVEDHDVEAVPASGVDSALGGCDRVVRVERIDGNLDLPPELLELIDRGRSLEVACDESRALPLTAQEECELGGGCRLSRALEPREEYDRGRLPEREPGVARAHERRQLLVHHLHDLLSRREALQDVLPERTLLDRRREVLRDLEVDVGLEQREAHLAHCLGDRLLVEPAAATEATQGALQPVGERVEHGSQA